MPFPVLFDPDECDVRELWMPPALVTTLTQKDPKKARDYCANVRAYLGRFVKGDPRIDNCDYMKLLKSDIFEMRVQNQKRGEKLRIFGAFGEVDKFVALFCRYRHYFGGRSDPKWDHEINRAIACWDDLFPGCHRMKARPFSNCVSNGVDIPIGE